MSRRSQSSILIKQLFVKKKKKKKRFVRIPYYICLVKKSKILQNNVRIFVIIHGLSKTGIGMYVYIYIYLTYHVVKLLYSTSY